MDTKRSWTTAEARLLLDEQEPGTVMIAEKFRPLIKGTDGKWCFIRELGKAHSGGEAIAIDIAHGRLGTWSMS